jgi:hypothetical protein
MANAMPHRRRTVDEFPNIYTLPVPTPTLSGPVNLERLISRMTGIQTRSMRRARTGIPRDASRRFFEELFRRLGVPFMSAGSNQFHHPYDNNIVEDIPTTLEDLLRLYMVYGQYHDALPLLVDEESDLEDEVNDEIIMIDDDDDFDFPDELDSDLSKWHKAKFDKGKYHVDIWIRYIKRERGTEQGHYDEQYGPVVISEDDFLLLSSSGYDGQEARVQRALRICKNSSLEEEDYPKLYYDAGIVDRGYVGTLRVARTTFNSGKSTAFTFPFVSNLRVFF